jgi:hypothetical protein
MTTQEKADSRAAYDCHAIGKRGRIIAQGIRYACDPADAAEEFLQSVKLKGIASVIARRLPTVMEAQCTFYQHLQSRKKCVHCGKTKEQHQ